MAFAVDLSVSPKQYAFRALLGMASISVLGIIAAWFVGSPNVASRVGALIVVYGLAIVYLFEKRFGRDTPGHGDLYALDALHAAYERGAPFLPESEEQQKKASKIHGDFDRNKWIVRTELLIIGYGTLQWGFGDLLVSRGAM